MASTKGKSLLGRLAKIKCHCQTIAPCYYVASITQLTPSPAHEGVRVFLAVFVSAYLISTFRATSGCELGCSFSSWWGSCGSPISQEFLRLKTLVARIYWTLLSAFRLDLHSCAFTSVTEQDICCRLFAFKPPRNLLFTQALNRRQANLSNLSLPAFCFDSHVCAWRTLIWNFWRSDRCHNGFGPPGPDPLADMDPLSRIWIPLKISVLFY